MLAAMLSLTPLFLLQILSELQKGDHLGVLGKPARVAYSTVLLK